MSGNKAAQQQKQQQQLLFQSLASFQKDQDSALNAAQSAQQAERARIQAQVAADEERKKAEVKKAAEAPFVRSSVLTSPFGLLTQAPTANRTFLGS